MNYGTLPREFVIEMINTANDRWPTQTASFTDGAEWAYAKLTLELDRLSADKLSLETRLKLLEGAAEGVLAQYDIDHIKTVKQDHPLVILEEAIRFA